MQILRYLILFFPFLTACENVKITEIFAPFTAIDPKEPILQLDPGGHLAKINDVKFTPDGRYLVSAGNDKVIRVWDLETGKTVRTLRGQIGAGSEGKILAIALSPDGQWLAAGGWMGSQTDYENAIRLYNFADGELVALLKGHNNVVLSLAFSPDSHLLVSGSADQTAILWDIASKQQRSTLSGHTDFIHAVAFTPDSKRVVTGSYDNTLRLWQVENGQSIATLEGHTDKVRAVAISPQDGNIVSGSYDHQILLWDGQTGDFIKILANQGTWIGSLSFSPDGQWLLSSCGGGPPCNENPEHVWSYPSGQKMISYWDHDNIVLASAISPDGQWAATGGGNNNEIHLWATQDGKLKQQLKGVGSTTFVVGFSEEGKSLAWGKTDEGSWNAQEESFEYSIALPTQKLPLGAPRSLKERREFRRAQAQWQNWTLDIRPGEWGETAILDIRHQNNTVASIERGSTDGYSHRAYTFTPDGQHIISGGAVGVLTSYNREGKKVGKYVGHTGDVWAVAVSPDGGLLASASADQTIRLWNVQTYKNLLTLFHGNDGEWVAWAPSGYYAASPNGDQMVGWQINHGANKTADYVSAAQLRDHFYRPDIVDNMIRSQTQKQIVTQTDKNTKQIVAQADKKDFSLEQLKTALPPKFKIVEPSNNSNTDQKQLKVVLSVKVSEEPLKGIVAYVNGSSVGHFKKWAKQQRSDTEEKILTLPLQPGANQIRIEAKNRIGVTSQDLLVHFESNKPVETQGTLYIVAVGVSEYKNPAHNLRYAAIDARDIHDFFATQQGKQYSRVESKLLADGATQPTSANIKAALDLFNQATPDDTVILFLSGHGDNQGQDYYFLPYDTQEQDGGWDPNTVVKWRTLQNTLQETKGRRLLLVDTCHAGGAFNPRLIKDAADSNIVVLSATDRDSVAQELPALGHGVFTYALLEGLQGN